MFHFFLSGYVSFDNLTTPALPTLSPAAAAAAAVKKAHIKKMLTSNTIFGGFLGKVSFIVIYLKIRAKINPLLQTSSFPS